MTLYPFGKFVVSPEEPGEKYYWLTFVTSNGYSLVLSDKKQEFLQEIADHLNAVVSGKIKPPKPSRRR